MVLRAFSVLIATTILATGAALSGAAERDALECMVIRDRGGAAAESGPALDVEIPAGCRVRSRATLACAPASAEVGGEAADEDREALVFDRLCYELDCDDPAGRGETLSDERVLADDLGTRALRTGAPSMVCTPAVLLPATEEGEDGRRGRRAAIAGSRDSEIAFLQCGDFSGDGDLSATDALGILKTAVGSVSGCLPCVCDVDNNGSFTATDALTTLKKAVGQNVNLACRPDGNPVQWTGSIDNRSWHLAGNWNSNRVPDFCDAVSIPQAGTTVDHSEGANTARSIASNAELELSGGSLALRDTVQVNDTFTIRGGTLIDAVVLAPVGALATGTSGAPAPARVVMTTSGGLLDGVTMNDTLDLTAVSASVRVNNGLVLNSSAAMENNTSIHFQSGDSTLEGTGEIVFGSVGNKFLIVDGGSSLTIAPGMVIRGAIGQVGTSGALTNQGTIDSDEPGEIEVTSTTGWTNEADILGRNGGSLRLNGTWTNNADVSIADGGTLHLLGTWTNAGAIVSDASTVNLGGSFSLAALGDFQRTAGEVNLTGTFDNSANLLLDATTGSWNLRGGTIVGGTIDGADGSNLVMTTSGGLLDGVTMNSDLDLSTVSASVRVNNGLVLNSSAAMENNTSIHFQSGDSTLEGTGEIVFGSVGNKFLIVDGGSSLTIAPGMVIRGAIGQVGTSGALTNQGTIDSDEPGEIEVTSTTGWTNEADILGRNGGSLRLNGTWTNNADVSIADGGTLHLLGTWTNAGAIVSDASTVNLGGSFSLAALGDFQRTAGEVNLTGTFDNSANLLLDATTGSWNLRGGTIVGGTIDGADGSNLVMTTSGGLLDGVTMNSDLDLSTVSASVRVNNGLVLNSSAAMENNTSIHFQSGDSTLEGTGEIVFGSVGNKFLIVDGGSSLTIAPGMVIRGAIGQVGTSGALTNQGTIDSDEPGEIEVTSTTGWTNEADILGRNGGSLRLNGTWTNNADVSIADGGTLHLLGTWTNAGAIVSDASTVNLGGSFSLAALGDFQRTAGEVNLTGTFDNSANLLLDATTGSWNLRGGTIVGGTIDGADGSNLVMTTSGGLLDGVTMNSDLDLSTVSASVRVNNGLVLNSSAAMENNTSIHFQSGDSTLEGTGEIVFGSVGNKFLIVDGGSSLTIAPGMVIRGAIGQVGTSGALTNQGTIDSDEPGEIEVASTTGWTNEGTMRASGGNLATSGAGVNSGLIEIGAGLVLNARGGFQQGGAGSLSLELASSSSFGRVVVTGQAALGGTLDIVLSGGFDPAIGETFTVMTFGSASGDFQAVTGLDIGGGKVLQRTLEPTAMVLEVVSQ